MSKKSTKGTRGGDDAPEPLGRSVADETAAQASNEAAVQQRIAERAYQMYVDRGSEEGNAVDDWLEAEREITGGET